MPNIQQLLSEELRRQARKEVRTELVELKTQLTTMRKTIAEQNRRIKALEKIVPLPVKPQPSAEVPAEVKPVRITAARIIVLAKLTSVCYITRYANGKNKTTNRELRQIPAGIRTCCHTQKGLRRLLTFSMASTIKSSEINLDFHRVNSLLCWVSISIRFVIGNPEKSNREKPRNAKSRQSATWGNVSWQS